MTVMPSLLQAIILIEVITRSKENGINPDNVTTPMAASVGNLVTLSTSLFKWKYESMEYMEYNVSCRFPIHLFYQVSEVTLYSLFSRVFFFFLA